VIILKKKIGKAKNIEGVITVPGDKSISHRSIMLGALADGETVVDGFLESADCLSTVSCIKAMGVSVEKQGTLYVVKGKGIEGFKEPSDILDCGNSGTTIRLLSGLVAGLGFHAILTGDHSLRNRPMTRVKNPLVQMGARFDGREGGKYAPISLRGGFLHGIDYRMQVASAQVKSAILLAGLNASGDTSVFELLSSRDHTERMLASFGADIDVHRASDGTTIKLKASSLKAVNIEVPGDISSAAFFLTAAAAMPGSELTVKNIGLNPVRTGILRVLTRMGASVEILNERLSAGEIVGDVKIKGTHLHGVQVTDAEIPALIDEVPIIAVAAAIAEGETVITGASELKVKESDRLAVMASELTAVGVDVEELPDGLIIRGGKPIRGGLVHSHQDHRIAMAMAICGLFSTDGIEIEGAEAVSISFPDFFDRLQSVCGK